MNNYIVTIKLARRSDHDPKHKKTDRCPFHGSVCTDSTGEHHSGLVRGRTAEEVRAQFAENYHVTRVEGAVYIGAAEVV